MELGKLCPKNAPSFSTVPQPLFMNKMDQKKKTKTRFANLTFT